MSILTTALSVCTRALLWTHGVVVSELEPAKYRLLPLTWSRAYEGVDGVSAGRFGHGTTKQINIQKILNTILKYLNDYGR